MTKCKPTLLKATHAGTIRIGDVELPCYVLNNGTRVVSQKEMLSALALSRGGAGAGKGDRLATFVAGSKIKPFVSEDLAKGIHSAIQFRIAGVAGRPSFAYEATVLADLCTAIINARMEGRLQKQQEHIARSAARLQGAFAKLGIIATIDEATGYQQERAPDALQSLLRTFIDEKPSRWEKRFDDDFYARLYRLTKLTKRGRNHPRYFGILTRKFFWERFAGLPGAMRELERVNPANAAGNRSNRYHQHLTRGHGIDAFTAHKIRVETILDLAQTVEQARLLLEMALPAPNDTIPFPFLEALLAKGDGGAR